MLVGKGTTGKYITATDTINSFLTDVRRYTVPTPQEEEALVRRYKENHDEEAKSELICRNLRFIFSIAKVYAKTESELLDYVNEGVEGFDKAFENFDLSRGYRFITYASFFLRRQMNLYMTVTRNLVRKSNTAKLSKPIEKIKQKEFAETGLIPADDKIKEILESEYGITIKDVTDLYDLVVTSINEEVDDDYTVEDTSEYASVTATRNDYEEEIERDYAENTVNKVIGILPEKQQNILKQLFGIGCEEKSAEQLAYEMDCDIDDIEKIKNKIFKYIRQNVSRERISL